MHRRWTTRAIVAVALTLAFLVAPAARADRMPMPSSTPTVQATPEQQAARELKSGERLLERAEAAAADGKADKARKSFERAARSFQKAADLAPSAAAFNGLGYALRKTGDYDAALAAYDRALQIEPRFAQAIEYRAEAYLALGRLDDVRKAYMLLFQNARPHADELLAAVNAWIADGGANGAVAAEELAEFTAWAQERTQLAGQTSALSGAPASDGW
jgi:tetratricopeptide (TPR) repeat protein